MGKKYSRIIILIFVDMAIVAVSSIFPLALRFGIFTMDVTYLEPALKCLPADIVITVIVMALFKLYNRVWTYAGIDELMSVLKASLIIEALYVAYRLFMGVAMPRSFYVFNWVFLFLLLAASRVSVRLFRQIRRKYTKEVSSHRLMIIGAGSAASVLIRELQYNSSSKIACLIDDNPGKKGKYIHGIPIVGNRQDIPHMVEKYEVDEIIIAIPSAPPRTIRDIISICNETPAKLKILPAIASTLTSSLSQKVREVNYEDLLGRDAVVINNREVESFVSEKTVMVTGGGGTIGSELCRQIVANKPKRLLVIDIYENGAYELQMELLRNYPEADVKVLIASVRDYDRMKMIFEEYQPEIIYHAAAHKHVPLMEYSPNEAVKNNCKGTLNMAKLSDEYGVKRFVLISTDKAVRPTNVMGATKRICEMIVQSYNKMSETEFVAVRFGNVLGSNGSVIPLFLKQIEAGGPVTLTHRDITRFFMTVSEAVSLVLQAGLLAKGGEIFVLDMGQPVKIYDLAVNLIRLKGYVPGEDIKIEIVGLRPGEKLYEELLMAEEGLESTPNELIYIGQPIDMNCRKFLQQLDKLIETAEKNSDQIKAEIERVCDTYNPQLS
ncbi:polysaccharide biosynthesis protein [Anaerovorax odorimutans]|uniref:Polysaccharide biosynthesis protein n=1 Tax=Anaerovorax odorimutans TaxID=109327 RepID=A0ABT1RJD6_9FIRM|nr:nucleoside-diphosphate sugar epimerase/dehydratase [Anaerovorax odorimutans]MCQ4635292.1 polysaccharide biosynthesis protein [Anaerovorax odorimutans]